MPDPIPTDKVEAPVVEAPKEEVKVETPVIETPAKEEDAKSLMDEATVEEKPKETTEEKPVVVPEKYDIKVPEGMSLDQALLDKVTPIFKEAKLTQEAAQKLTDIYADTVKSATKAIEETNKTNFNKFVEDLKSETIKSLGSNYKQELVFAAKTRDRLMSKDLIDKLNVSGLANDKDVVGFLIKVGRSISEGKLVEGSASGAEEKDPLKILYPTTSK